MIRGMVVLLLGTAVSQLWANLPIGLVLSTFAEGAEQSRYLAARTYYMVCVAVYFGCAFILFRRRITHRNMGFNLPLRGEVLLHCGSLPILAIGGIPLDLSFEGAENLLRVLEYWTYLGCGSVAELWLSITGAFFFGPRERLEDLNIYLRGRTGMPLKDDTKSSLD